MNLKKLSLRCKTVYDSLIRSGYPTYLLNDMVYNCVDEWDLFNRLRFFARHWQPKSE